MPDTGMFYLLEVKLQPCLGGVEVDLVRAQCNACQRMFTARSRPELHNIGESGAVLACPKCGNRQAVSGARFLEFLTRFPHGFPLDAADRSLVTPADQDLPPR